MAEENTAELVAALCAELFGEEAVHRLSRWGPVLDVSRENIHDTKAEFLKEYAAVEKVCDLSSQIVQSLLADELMSDPQHAQMIARLHGAINSISRKDRRDIDNPSASNVILNNISDYGFFSNSLHVLINLTTIYGKRLDDLDRQREEFWSVPHRAPNYYARTIALRFARLFARERGVKPTFGTASDGGYPSTEFGRALEQLFSILGIKASVRNAAEWAIGQLTESDWSQNALRLGGILGLGDEYVPKRNALLEAVENVQKARKK